MTSILNIISRNLSKHLKYAPIRLYGSRYDKDCSPPEPAPTQPLPNVCVESISCPVMIPDCPRPCPEIPTKMPPLVRLKKKRIKLKVAQCLKYQCPPRADDGMVIKMKTLPVICPRGCVCVEPPPLIDKGGFKRLKKRVVLQKIPICRGEACPPRADEGMKIKEKVLPYVPPGPCKCVEHTISDAPPLKRLVKRIIRPPPPSTLPEECKPKGCPVKKQQVKKKRLPCLKPNDCKCFEPPPLTSVPLGRPKKELVCPQPKTPPCVKDDCPARADVVCKYVIKEKTLPTLLLCQKSNNISISEYQLRKKNERKEEVKTTDGKK